MPQWQMFVLILVAMLSLAAGYEAGGFFDGIMALAINTLIAYGLIRLGYKFFNKKTEKPEEKA